MKQGIKVISGFDVRSASPIDGRLVCETLEEMNNLDTAYDGMIVSCLEDSTIYVRFNGVFEPWKTRSSSFTYSLPLTLSAGEGNENDYLIRD